MMDWRTTVSDKRVELIALLVVILLLILTVIDIGSAFFEQRIPVYKQSFVLKRVPAQIPNIASWHLFGLYQDKSLPKTQLELDLQGIFFNTISKKSRALINVPGQTVNAYSKGQKVPGGAKIYKISPDRVILQHSGKLEVLPLKRKQLHEENNYAITTS